MNKKVGKYSVTYGFDNTSQAMTIHIIHDDVENKKYNGFLYVTSRKVYDKFFEDLKNDIIPPNFKLWVKPEDVMSEAEVKAVLEWRAKG